MRCGSAEESREVGDGGVISSVASRVNVGMAKIISLEQERFALLFRQRISEAIPKIKARTMPAFAEIAIRLAGNFCLPVGHCLDDNLRFAEEVIEAAAGDGIAAAIDHNGSLNITNRRNATRLGPVHGLRHHWRLRFGPQNGDDGRRIEDHFGSPFSSYNISP